MVELKFTTTTSTLLFTAGEYIVYNDGVDNHCIITSINATDATVNVKYSTTKTIVEDIPWITCRISSILGEGYL